MTLSPVVIGFPLVGSRLLMVLKVSDDFTQHVNEAPESERDFCIQLVIINEVI